MQNLDLIIDLHVRNDRQGPGGDDETRRAIDLARLDRSRHLECADIGCGTGASTLVLARELDAHITAVDAAEVFVGRLGERARAANVADRIDAQVADMAALPFAERSLDLIWCESAIYNLGFAEGLRAWRQFLRPGATLVVSELTWTTGTRPPGVEAHWAREYPGITTASANIAALERDGYEPMGYFVIPPRCWQENYHAPLRAGFDAFLDRHAHSDDAERLVAAERAEIAHYAEHARWYAYAFYVARRRDDPT